MTCSSSPVFPRNTSKRVTFKMDVLPLDLLFCFFCIHRSVTLGELHDNDRLQGPWTRIQLENESNRKPMRSQISPARTYVYMCIFTVHSWLVRPVFFLPLSCFRGTVIMRYIYMYILHIYVYIYIYMYCKLASQWLLNAVQLLQRTVFHAQRHQHLSYQIFSFGCRRFECNHRQGL